MTGTTKEIREAQRRRNILFNDKTFKKREDKKITKNVNPYGYKRIV